MLDNLSPKFPSPIIPPRESVTIVCVGWWASLRSTTPYKIIRASGAREPGRLPEVLDSDYASGQRLFSI
jgi:hypothetical protein